LLNNKQVAIKFEPRKSDAPQLRDEYRTYKMMAGSGIVQKKKKKGNIIPAFFNIFGLVGVPNAYYFGQEGLHNILVIDLLGPSLEDMFDICGRKFSVKTVCMLAINMVIKQRIYDYNE
jgi:casein kinase 1